MSTQVCLHCETPLAGTVTRQVMVNDEPRPVCSEGCETAAQTIIDKGLLDFYRYRDAPEGTRGDGDPHLRRWAGYDRRALQNEFVTFHADGSRTAHLLLNGVRCAACSWLVERGLGTLEGLKLGEPLGAVL